MDTTQTVDYRAFVVARHHSASAVSKKCSSACGK